MIKSHKQLTGDIRPQLYAQPDASDNHLESHNAWMVRFLSVAIYS
jgi:hypothetical protein